MYLETEKPRFHADAERKIQQTKPGVSTGSVKSSDFGMNKLVRSRFNSQTYHPSVGKLQQIFEHP